MLLILDFVQCYECRTNGFFYALTDMFTETDQMVELMFAPTC